MNVRKSISLHLQSAIADSDKLLQTLTSVTESLAVADHECDLAIKKFDTEKCRSEELEKQLKFFNCELSRASLRMIELVRCRDYRAIDVNVAEQQVVLRNEQIKQLEVEVERIQNLVFSLAAECAKTVEKYRQAQREE
ncbi:hypothetical protein N7532_006437 [Penicillium argentinense]|uniref:Uncharacterized protein n=1 Tax=Penicillium argentinense TaxID=1131581 RepID=A0A9W9KBB4_9EURO|nr:uncharacterized protein N7532_006437 [Penicillium argentinense]KAJ5099436.1 hypothetical protein N7532_006437 [Penicillium argentinense]